jgi:Mrp family chromosome partitioning ATPase
MSLLLNALKRIEARQSPGCAGQAAAAFVPIDLPSEVISSILIGELPRIDREDSPLSVRAEFDVAVDHIQALVSEAEEQSALDDVEQLLEQGATEDADPPVIEPVNTDSHIEMARGIIHQLPQGHCQVLLFTSPVEGHGKTMTLARLAPRLAQGLPGNVLVVDANFRNPDMAHWLNVAPAWRLPEVLSGQADWATAVRTTSHPQVSLLPGGRDPSEQGLLVRAMGQLLRELARHYELVVVDASSLEHRLAARLAGVCDATYLVSRLGEVSPRMLREAARVIAASGGRLLGCVAIDAGA